MDCDKCLERLYPYLDRELDERELAEVKRHLDDCPPCEGSYVFERRFLDLIRDSCTQDVAPSALRERIVLRLRDLR
ncbi:MAG: mycothiol system anti-sigma-R factor [Chloroflexi bacterium]|nr:mycothiol system anti-sigma-R factor [Chloroflexota bacterium]